MVQETNSPEETFRLAEKIGECAEAGDVIALDGDLGAGKTVFAQGIASGLGIKGPVTSPTFVILQEYQGGRLPYYHFDVYRIDDPDELLEIGAEEYFYGNGVCVVEWASMIEDLLPPDAVRIYIASDPEKGWNCRKITLHGLSVEKENRIRGGER